MTPKQREAAERLAAELETFYSSSAIEASDLLRELLAEPEPATGYCKHCKQYTIEEPLPAEPHGEPATVNESLTVEPPAQAFYKGADAEPAYAQYERGVRDGFEIGQREARIAILDGAENEPQCEPVAWMFARRYGNGLSFVKPSPPDDDEFPPHVPLFAHPPQQRKPLTDEQIRRCVDEALWHGLNVVDQLSDFTINVVRAIERAHGIGESA